MGRVGQFLDFRFWILDFLPPRSNRRLRRLTQIFVDAQRAGGTPAPQTRTGDNLTLFRTSRTLEVSTVHRGTPSSHN